jgi:GT2 family glycosyltransferase
MNNQPLVIAQVLNMNGLDLLKKGIPLLFAQDYENLKVEVIDNGSTDGSVEYLEQNFPNIYIIKNKTNIGLAKARNQGFKSAINKKAEYVITLDNDTYLIDNSTISKLINEIFFQNIKNFFAIGVKLKEGIDFSTENNGQIIFPKQVKRKKYFNKFRAVASSTNKLINANYVDFVSGCFMFINVKSLKSVGLIDERYNIYFEEADLCFRAWQKGFSSIIFPNIEAQHQKTTTNITWSAFYTYYTIRNFLIFTKSHIKNASHKNLFRYLRIKKAKGYAIIALGNSIKQKSFKSVIKSVVLAFYDYYFNKNRYRY